MGRTEEKIRELEELISSSKYNKRTQHAIGLYKAQLARLRERQDTAAKKGPRTEGYQVRKGGDGTVILLGFPSVGKSTLLNALTNANSEVGQYAFTTLSVIPGMLEYQHARIQILDVPGVVQGAASGRGRGKEVLACMRSADLCLIVLDAQQPGQLEILRREIAETGIRLDQHPPDVRVSRKVRAGISIGTTLTLRRIDATTIEAILKEFRINNADVVIREDIDADQLIDVLMGNRIYMPSLVVVNKADTLAPADRKRIEEQIRPALFISARDRGHIGELKQLIFERLGLMKIFLREPGKEADLKEPLIMPRHSRIGDVCRKLHKDFLKQFRFARVWGPSARFDGQRVMLRHTLRDGDILELHIR